MIIRKALASDSPGLNRLASLIPIGGSISLRIERQSDFFLLLRKRGDYTVWVAEDQDGAIVGSFSKTKQAFVINGKRRGVTQLADLRIHPAFLGTDLAFRLVKSMWDELREEEVDILYCMAAHGNLMADAFFGGKLGIPPFQKLSTFLVHQLLPKKMRKRHTREFANETELDAFYKKFYSAYNFHPPIDDFSRCTHFVKKHENLIAAAVSLSDTFSLKQYVLINYPQSTAIRLGLLQMLNLIFPLAPIPSRGTRLRILYTKWIGFAQNKQAMLVSLLEQVRQYAFENNYHLISVAIDEKDKDLSRLFKGMSSFTFQSDAWMTSLQDHMPLVKALSENKAYEDFSLI
ncbi:MAG: GNAT family N-acetyltransferase [Chitinophagales bacterium]